MDWINLFFAWSFWIEAAAMVLMAIILFICGIMNLIRHKRKGSKKKCQKENH